MVKKGKDLVGQAAHQLACHKLQEKLNKRAKGDFLDKAALCISQGLKAKVTKFAQHEGEFTDSRDCIDYKTRATYCSISLDVFGAKAPEKREVTVTHDLSGRLDKALRERAKFDLPSTSPGD